MTKDSLLQNTWPLESEIRDILRCNEGCPASDLASIIVEEVKEWLRMEEIRQGKDQLVMRHLARRGKQ